MSLVLGWHATFDSIGDVVDLHLRKETGWCPAIQVFTKNAVPKYVDILDRVYLVVHGSYRINFMKCGIEWAIQSAVDDIRFLDGLIDIETRKRTGVVIHLGKNTEQLSFDECMEHFARNVQEILYRTRENSVRLILETSVKTKNDLFWSVESLGKLSHRIESLIGKELYESRIGFCIDTAHIFASGYDIRSVEGVRDFLRLWDEYIGVRRITLIHLNDSKVGLGCCRDLHQQLGKGELYSEDRSGLTFLLEWCRRSFTPVILETGGEMEEEISLLKELV